MDTAIITEHIQTRPAIIICSCIGHHTSYHHRRYQTAVKVVEYALKSLQDDIYCDGEEVVKALKQIYTDKATYKMIKIKKYVNDNGYSNAILSKVNIDTPKIP